MLLSLEEVIGELTATMSLAPVQTDHTVEAM